MSLQVTYAGRYLEIGAIMRWMVFPLTCLVVISAWGAEPEDSPATRPATRPAATASGDGWEVKWAVQREVFPDRVEIKADGKAMVVEVTYVGGISDVTISLVEGEWPERIQFIFPGPVLESFGAKGGTWRVNGLMQGNGGGLATEQRNDRGEWVQVRLPEGERGSIRLVGEQRVEVVLPSRILREEREIRVAWIDAFRR